jgi:hypothetical protein
MLSVSIIPEIECAHYIASLQHLIDDDAYNSIIVASTHWSVRMRHDDTALSPSCSGIISSRIVEYVWMVNAAVERGIIVYRGYREAVVGL